MRVLLHSSSEQALDQPPAGWIIRILTGKFPDRMKMIRQDDLSDDFERMALSYFVGDINEQLDVRQLDEYFSTLIGDDGEEKGPARRK